MGLQIHFDRRSCLSGSIRNPYPAIVCDVCGQEIKDRQGLCLWRWDEYARPQQPAFTCNKPLCLKRFDEAGYESAMGMSDFLSDLFNGLSPGPKEPIRSIQRVREFLLSHSSQKKMVFSRTDFQQILGISKANANRQLVALVAVGIVTVEGLGRKTRYVLKG